MSSFVKYFVQITRDKKKQLNARLRRKSFNFVVSFHCLHILLESWRWKKRKIKKKQQLFGTSLYFDVWFSSWTHQTFFISAAICHMDLIKLVCDISFESKTYSKEGECSDQFTPCPTKFTRLICLILKISL